MTTQGNWKNYGHDHVLIISITAYEVFGARIQNFVEAKCHNCTILIIETTPSQVAPREQCNKKWWYAVPYPSSFHWSESLKADPWAIKNRSTLVAYFGSVQVSKNSPSGPLRQKIIDDCYAVNDNSICNANKPHRRDQVKY
jgi:hypothetical protein